uniref:DUF1833 family protein n=1 Tax=Halomonas sp. TaxID=1486246 RepID=UPI00263775FD|nr:DUF1833 family protein [Halomonas sp.]
MAVRSISAGAVRELFAQHSDAVMLMCLAFSHADMSEPVRIVNNKVAIQFDGHQWIGLPFEPTLPEDTDEKIPNVQIRVDNVDRTLVELLRSVSSMPSVRMYVVRVQNGTVTREIGPLDLSLLSHDIGIDTITLDIGYAIDLLNEPACQDILNPGTAPGLFN